MTEKIKKVLIIIWNEFIYGGHLQCLGLVGIVYISSFLLNLRADWEILLSTYLIFYPIYINDRFQGIQLDQLTNPERTKHFKIYLSLMPKLIAFSILLLIILLFYIRNLNFSIFTLILLLLGLLYPFYFKNLTKKIFAFKNFYVATFFAIVVTLPVFYHKLELNIDLIILLGILMLFVFLKTVLMQILLDCKDVETDKALRLLTLPVIISKEKSLIFLEISSTVITTLILFISVFFLEIFPSQVLILLLIIPFNFYSYKLARNKNYFGYILGSGEFVLWLLLIIITKIIL